VTCPFTVSSYNILAHEYCTATTFPYVPRHVLSSKYRIKALAAELQCYHADIMCFQVYQAECSQIYSYFRKLIAMNRCVQYYVPWDIKDCITNVRGKNQMDARYFSAKSGTELT